ncbi:hypothetical protein AURDEDRAFT_174419 [Auricularia subglabra TFB-10046 SS5]|uniref:DUF6534 domain-containing protein n=1 Tax=Auricularia subglabra (strain TFB-10046 / SS5) TaxID=717982 RepID=J0D9S1_AURST|nr:hypothetical protein AURDEDRAFT_174419 [Auricularia subglabra TFB-10046 SS5]
MVQRAPPSADALAASFSSLDIGNYVSAFLLGTATLQAWDYFRDFPQDSLPTKLTVVTSYSRDVLQSLFFAHAVHHYASFLSPLRTLALLQSAAVVDIVWSMDVTIVLESLMIAAVQSYFGLRVYRLTRSLALAIGIWSIAVFRLGITLGIAVVCIRDGTMAVVGTKVFEFQAISGTAITAFTDIATAAILCSALLSRRTGFAHTDRLIDRIVAFTIGSGLLTSFISIAELVSVTIRDESVWIAFFSVSSKMFSNSFLASLNERGPNRLALSPHRGSSAVTQTSTRITFRQPPVIPQTDESDPEAVELAMKPQHQLA